MRIYYVNPLLAGPLSPTSSGHWPRLCAHAQALGFDTLMTTPLWTPAPAPNPYLPNETESDFAAGLTLLATLCTTHHLKLMVDLVLDSNDTNENSASPPPEWDAWVERLNTWVNNGVSGFRCEALSRIHPADWQTIIAGVHAVHPDCHFLAWTPGLDPWQLESLAGVGFTGVFSSLPWWDFRAPWLVEEYLRLRAIAPVIAPVEAPYLKRVAAWREDDEGQYLNAKRAMWTAAVVGDGSIFVPMGFENNAKQPLVSPDTTTPLASFDAISPHPDFFPIEETAKPTQLALYHEILQANEWLARTSVEPGTLYSLLGPLSPVTALFRGDGQPYSTRGAPHDTGRLVVLNPDDTHPVPLDWQTLGARLPDNYTHAKNEDLDAEHILSDALGAGDILHLDTYRKPAVVCKTLSEYPALTTAMRTARIVIENITPTLDEGKSAIKRVIGEPIQVQADVYVDRYYPIGVALLWRTVDEKTWERAPMHCTGNDAWEGEFCPERNGLYYFKIQAWIDTWESFRQDLQHKHRAGKNVALEMSEGQYRLTQAIYRLSAAAPAADLLHETLARLGVKVNRSKLYQLYQKIYKPAPSITFTAPTPEQVALLLSDKVAQAMQEADAQPFETNSVEYGVMIDRPAARFANWYELFPRSQTEDPNRHGTFDDVIKQLPRIRDMGFDTLYFPPIHPIGQQYRKGPNNSLYAKPEDLGCPYAIGSQAGGHESTHPELGSLEDFQHLVHAAQKQGLEIALDFALHCSPDHPWVRMYPQWFKQHLDGSLNMLENPPQQYHDIMDIDFYGPKRDAKQQQLLWCLLRDIAIFWIKQGVRVFRVDNPHTKPLPFWKWLIKDVQSRYPETLFLSAAFTTPKMMYRLSKLGFTQSYTYFTWRETKQELIAYMTELNQAPLPEFFRPHFFVNTPDINPRFLHTSGRPGFLIRSALATTLSGLWGVYNGFELCEAHARADTEEAYQDSEKYEIRVWDHARPGNIIPEITRLNQIRRTNLALQTHLGLQFHLCHDDRVLFFSKATPEQDNILLIAISLDPFETRTACVELPFEHFGVTSNTLYVEDLLEGYRYSWYGSSQTFSLSPEKPYRIWRVTPSH